LFSGLLYARERANKLTSHSMSEEAAVIYFKCSETRVPPVIRRVLLRKGWVEWDKDKDPEELWSLHWKSGRFKLSDWDRCLSHQRINHCPKSSNITKKDNLHRNIKRLAGSYGPIFNFVPTTFVLPNEYVAFMREYAEREEEKPLWICKPSDSSRGRGIFLISDMSQLVYDQQYVVQEYIANPLLVGGFKFDLRLYVLVTSFHPIRCYLYREGLVRFATEKYSKDSSSIANLFAHLTNSSINKFSPSLDEHKDTVGSGCKWTLTRLRKYLSSAGVDDSLLFERIKHIIILTTLALWPKIPRQTSGFELFGFDVMVDSELKPWLIEVNSSPALATDTELDVEVKDALISDTIDLLGFAPAPKEPKEPKKRKQGIEQTKPPAGRPDHSAILTSMSSTVKSRGPWLAHHKSASAGRLQVETEAKNPLSSSGKVANRDLSSKTKHASLSARTLTQGAEEASAPSVSSLRPPLAPRLRTLSRSASSTPPAGASRQAKENVCARNKPAQPGGGEEAKEEKLGGFELVFPHTSELKQQCEKCLQSNSVDIRPFVQAIKEAELRLRKEARGSRKAAGEE